MGIIVVTDILLFYAKIRGVIGLKSMEMIGAVSSEIKRENTKMINRQKLRFETWPYNGKKIKMETSERAIIKKQSEMAKLFRWIVMTWQDEKNVL